MKIVTLYTTPFCGYCAAAKRLLTGKGASFQEIDIFSQPDRRAEMIQRANGRRAVPQIFVGEDHIGGFDDLSGLERAGKLDPMLAE